MKYRLIVPLITMTLVASQLACAQSPIGCTEPQIETNKAVVTIFTLLEAAENGDVKAQLELGEKYRDGDGVIQNYREAAKWIRKAAEQGYASAQAVLGMSYDFGEVKQDYKEAAKWYRLAAEQGDRLGQLGLGNLLKAGDGVPQDYIEAMKWYRLAADQGSVSAQYYLGGMYEEGLGVPQDLKEAIKWYRKAAAQGDDGARLRLKELHE